MLRQLFVTVFVVAPVSDLPNFDVEVSLKMIDPKDLLKYLLTFCLR